MTKKLYRSQKDKMIAGVCGGLSEYFEVDVTIVRLLFVLVLILGGSAILLYLILWLVLPRNPNEPIALNKERVKDVMEEIKDKAQEARKEMTKDVEEGNGRKRRHHLFGWILVILGLIFLANTLLPSIFQPPLLRFWPLLLVVLGVVLIARPGR